MPILKIKIKKINKPKSKMQSKSNIKHNTLSNETQKSKSIEPKQDTGEKSSSRSELLKIAKKASNVEKFPFITTITTKINKEKSELQKENKENIKSKEETTSKSTINSNREKKPSTSTKGFAAVTWVLEGKAGPKKAEKVQKAQKEPNGKVERKESNKNSSGKAAPKGFFYNENDELMPVFMKKLAQYKNKNKMQNKILLQRKLQAQARSPQIKYEMNLNQPSSEEKSSSEHLEEPLTSRASSSESKSSLASLGSEAVADLLKKNKEWVTDTLQKNPKFLKEISAPQHPKYLIITCSDSRILTSQILGTHPGELFVHRNIGNLVLSADFNFQSVLSFALENLKVKNIIVLGHTDCGAIKTSLSNKFHGLIDHWLQPIKDIVEKHHDKLDLVMKKDPEKLTTKLSKLNVKEQVINLCKNPIVQKAWNEGQQLYIHGLLFDMETGFVKDLRTVKREWRMIEDIHALDFSK